MPPNKYTKYHTLYKQTNTKTKKLNYNEYPIYKKTPAYSPRLNTTNKYYRINKGKPRTNLAIYKTNQKKNRQTYTTSIHTQMATQQKTYKSHKHTTYTPTIKTYKITHNHSHNTTTKTRITPQH